MPTGAAPAAFQRAAWRHASSVTCSPMTPMRPVSSARGMNRPGWNLAAGGVLPPGEGLEPDDVTGVGPHLDLVVDAEAAVLERVAQRVLGLEPLGDPGPHLGVEELHPAAAVLLGPVHRDVGVAQQRRGVLRADPQRHPDAGGDVHLDPLNDERLVEDLHDPLGERDHRVVVGQVLGDHDELVAAEPTDRVRRAGATPEPLPGLHQDPVAGVVAEVVVDELDPVQVDIEDTERAGPPPGPQDRLAEPVEEQRPVREPGELVVGRLAAQLPLHLLELGDVARDRRAVLDTARLVVGEQHQGHRGRPARPGQGRLAPPFAVALHPGERLVVEPLPAHRVEQLGDGAPGEVVVGWDAELGAADPVQVQELAADVEEGHQIGGRLEEQGEPLAFAAGVDLVGDVGDRDEPVRVVVLEGPDLDPGPAQLPVGAGEPHRGPLVGAVPPGPLGQAVHRPPVAGMEQVADPGAALDQARSDHGPRRGVLEHDPAVPVDLSHRDRRVLGHRDEAGVLGRDPRLAAGPQLVVQVGHLGARDRQGTFQEVPVVVGVGVRGVDPAEERRPRLGAGRTVVAQAQAAQLAGQDPMATAHNSPIAVIVMVWWCRSARPSWWGAISP